MGCDYYIYTVLEIYPKNKSMIRKTMDFARGYYPEFSFEETDNKTMDELWEEHLDSYSEEYDVYEDEKWHVKNTQKYLDYIIAEGLKIEDIKYIRILKYADER